MFPVLSKARIGAIGGGIIALVASAVASNPQYV